jgi:predicted nucleotidyltransferase
MLNPKIKQQIISVLQAYGATKIGIFGSYARHEETPDSDIDILVEFSEVKTLLELIGIENELSNALKIKVDLLTENAISPYLIEGIRRELEVIYG